MLTQSLAGNPAVSPLTSEMGDAFEADTLKDDSNIDTEAAVIGTGSHFVEDDGHPAHLTATAMERMTPSSIASLGSEANHTNASSHASAAINLPSGRDAEGRDESCECTSDSDKCEDKNEQVGNEDRGGSSRLHSFNGKKLVSLSLM